MIENKNNDGGPSTLCESIDNKSVQFNPKFSVSRHAKTNEISDISLLEALEIVRNPDIDTVKLNARVRGFYASWLSLYDMPVIEAAGALPVSDEKEDSEKKLAEAQKAEKAYDDEKKKLRLAHFSGTFAPVRKSENLTQHSSLVVIDIDGITTVERVELLKGLITHDPFCHFVFISPSGYGLKVGVRVAIDDVTDLKAINGVDGHNTGSHRGFYEAVMDHFENDKRYAEYLTKDKDGKKAVDEKCKDVVRGCFLSYDKFVFHNPNSDVFEKQKIVHPTIKTYDCLSVNENINNSTDNKPVQLHLRLQNPKDILEMLKWVDKNDPVNEEGKRDYSVWTDMMAAINASTLSRQQKIDVMFKWRGDMPEILNKIDGLNRSHFYQLVAKAKEAGYVPPLDLLYDLSTSKMWLPTTSGDWQSYSTERVCKHLVKYKHVENHLEADNACIDAQDGNAVSYANRLAGWPKGIKHSGNGKKVLIVEGPENIVVLPKQEEPWEKIKWLVDTTLGHDLVGRETFYLWCRSAFNQNYHDPLNVDPKWTFGHILALCGNAGVGKSLIIQLITRILGEFVSKDAWSWIAKGDRFNSTLFECAHLSIEDTGVEGLHASTRGAISNVLKDITQNRYHDCEGKGVNKISLDPLWRCTISTNMSPAKLAVIPVISDAAGTADKIIILHCKRDTNADPFPRNMLLEWGPAMFAEVPAFCYWLKNVFVPWTEVPEHVLPNAQREENRFGFHAYQSQEVLDMIGDLSREDELLSMIDEEFFAEHLNATQCDMGPAEILESFFSSFLLQARARKAYSNAKEIGKLLTTLSNRQDGRVVKLPRCNKGQRYRLLRNPVD